MKKLLIGMLIACSLSLVACGGNDTGNQSTNNTPSTGVTEGSNGNGTMNGDGNGTMNGNGTTNGTNSNNQVDPSNAMNTSLNDLYTEFKGKVEGGVENIKAEDWDKYSTEFRGKLTNLRNTTTDTSMTGTLDDMESLFNEYDTSIREKRDVDKNKIGDVQKRIEDALR